MGKILTQAQKTFTDLYDSYVLNLSSDIIAVPCDQYGKSTEICTTKIIYSASAGTVDVGASCEVDKTTVPSGVTCTTNMDGEIVIEVSKDVELDDDSEMRFIFTTKNSNTFVFTRYITFIKVKAGANGESARSFQIKSEKGDTFDEGIGDITMEAIAFDGLTQISNASYAWERYTSSGWTPVLDDSSVIGENDVTHIYSQPKLTIEKSDAYDNPVFKCTITYEDDETDEDYYQLKVAHHNYESVVKFSGDAGTISSADPFVVAYVDLYKDHQKVDVNDTDYYYYHPDNVKTESGISINFDEVDGSYQTNGSLIYAIYKDETVMPAADATYFTISTGVSPSNTGSVTGGGKYTHGDNIKLTATPNEGYVFSNWADGSTENPRTITVTGDKTYTASFAIHQAEQYTITVRSNNSLHGSAHGSGTYDSGTTVTLTATANVGYVFEDWYENGVAKHWPKSINITVNSSRTITAQFRALISQDSGVTVTIQEDTDKTINVYKDNAVYLAFVPDSSGEYRFYSEENVPMSCYLYNANMNLLTSSSGTSTDNNFSIQYNFIADQTYYFGIQINRYYYEYDAATAVVYLESTGVAGKYIVNLSMSTGGDSVSGSGSYNAGDMVVVTAYAQDKYEFSHWIDETSNNIISYSQSYSFNIQRDTRLMAVFKKINITDEQIGYTITTIASPSEGGLVAGGGTYAANTFVTLNVTENNGFKFLYWDDGNTSISRTINVTQNATYTAIFQPPVNITVEASPEGAGTVSGTGAYKSGTSVILTASPSEGYNFSQWSDGSTSVIHTVQATYDTTYTAYFEKTAAPEVSYFTATINSSDAENNDIVCLAKNSTGTEAWNTNQFLEGQTVYFYAKANGNSKIAGITYVYNNDTETFSVEQLIQEDVLTADCTQLSIPLSVTSVMLGRSATMTVHFQSADNGSTVQVTFKPSYGYYKLVCNDTNVIYIYERSTYELNTYDKLELTYVPDEGRQLGRWCGEGYNPTLSYDNPYIVVVGSLESNYITNTSSSVSTYSAEPMMFSASPRMLSVEDEQIATYATTSNDGLRARYKSVLCQYNALTTKWTMLEDSSDYIYRNSLYSDVLTKTIVVSKEDVSNYRSIDVAVYKKVLEQNFSTVFDNDLIVSNTSFTVFDMNDPILHSTPPTSAKDGQLWLDTSKEPYVLYVYQDHEWKYFNQQMGKTIYTIEPKTYSVGDIWILSEPQYGYGQGTMLTSKVTVTVPGGFHISHWTDATPGTTEVINNIVESFYRDDTGITIAQESAKTKTSPFYVHINSQRMGFHSVADGVDTEVVHIGNKSAEIKNATLDGADGTHIKNDASFYNQVNILNENSDGTTSGFAFQTEDNGSFSLILVGN